jgi:class 3 adenylate cyclase/tetratricopeptide (TPR) repeat protein
VRTCGNCNEEIADEARFCPACGAHLPDNQSEVPKVRKTVTIVFCDVVDSTRLGERLDPEALRQVLARYYAAARVALERHGGTVEKFIGDAVMAVFGIPVVHEDDPLRAVRASVELSRAIDSLNEELERKWGVRISVRSGVNTGEVVAGDPSSGQAFATGDAVVVAQRLEQAAGAGEILLGEATARLVADSVSAEPLPPVHLKGKALPVTAWRLVDVEPGVSGRAPRIDSPFVGRSQELARLRSVFDQAASSETCRVVTVLGEPGVGKSRLARELVASLDGVAVVVEGRCLPYGRGITYWPVVEIIRSVTGLSPVHPPDRVHASIAELLCGEPDAQLVSERVAETLGVGEAGSPGEEVQWGVRKLFEALARDRPLLVVLDDIQWAEETFLDLIEYLAGWSRSAMLVCCLARPDVLDVRPSWGVGAAFETLALQPLPSSDVTRLIDNLLGSAPADAVMVARISRTTGGNPLFIEETLRMLIDEGLLLQRGGHWEVAREAEALGVPSSIQSVLAARLDRLPPRERATIQRASVIGEAFGWGAVADLAPADERAGVATHLHALMRKDLIRPDPHTLFGEDAFAFHHILIRDVAYESMPKRLRAELHERFADWAEAQADGSLGEFDDVIGFHLERAYRYRLELAYTDEATAALGDRAGRRLARAGRRAFIRGDMPAAAALLAGASDLLDRRARIALTPEFGLALQHMGEPERAEAELAAAIQSASEVRDRLLEARLQVILAHVRASSGKASMKETQRVAEAALSQLRRLRTDSGVVQAERLLAFTYAGQGRLAKMEKLVRRALRHAEAAGDARERQSCLSMLGYCLYLGPTPVESAISSCEAMLEQAEDDRLLEGGLTAFLGALHAMAGSFEDAREFSVRSRSIFADLGVRQGLASQRTYAATVELLADDAVAAERELSGASNGMLEDLPRTFHTNALLAEALYRQGRYQEARRYSAEVRRASEDNLYAQTAWYLLTARLRARDGDETAPETAHKALKLTEGTDALNLRADARMGLAETLSLLGRHGEALSAGHEAIQLYRRKGNVAALRKAEAELSAQFSIAPTVR